MRVMGSRMRRRQVELVIQSSGESKNVPVAVVVEKLRQFQASITHAGDYLAGGTFRRSGPSQESVSERCALVVTKASTGSFRATLALQDTQTTLGDHETLGEEAMDRIALIANCVEEGKEVERRLGEIIPDPQHRARIIDDLCGVWPTEGERVKVSLAIAGSGVPELTPRGQLVMKGVLTNLERQGARAASVRGVLSIMSVDPSPQVLKVVGPDGSIRCTYGKEFMETAKSLIGRAATVYGEAEYDAKGQVREIVNVTKLERFDEVTIQRAFEVGRELVLKNPLPLAVEYIDGLWSMECEDIGLLATAEDYDDCLQRVQDYLFFLWDEYAQEDDSKLSPGAKKLKTRLLALVRGPK
jgi:hypothetical protein